MTHELRPFIREPGTGVSYRGDARVYKVRDVHTGGVLALQEIKLTYPPRRTNLTVYRDTTAVYYVLAGACDFVFADGPVRCEPGSVIVIPNGVAFDMGSSGEGDATLLEIFCPPGPERVSEEWFFREEAAMPRPTPEEEEELLQHRFRVMRTVDTNDQSTGT